VNILFTECDVVRSGATNQRSDSS